MELAIAAICAIIADILLVIYLFVFSFELLNEDCKNKKDE